MDQLTQFITDHKIPVGEAGAAAFDWFTGTFQPVFDFITTWVGWVMDNSTAGLEKVPPLVFIVVVAALAYAIQRTWQIVVLVVVCLLFVLNQGLWQPTMETTVLVVYSTAVSLLIGIPVGILCARRPRLYVAISPLLDMMQVIPTFVYLIPALLLFGLGMMPALVATVIFAVALPIRTTYVGVSEVNKALVEAGESFGCTGWQLLMKVRIPAALPTIMIGVNQTIMLCLSMVVIAALVGAPGLGVSVVRALSQMNTALGIEGGLGIVVVAIVLDRILKRRVRARAKPKS
jgi:glycine betaine/proline transport system permease protein